MGFFHRPLRGVQPLSYTGWSTSNYLSRADTTLTNESFSYFAWVYAENIGDGNAKTIINLADTGGANGRYNMAISTGDLLVATKSNDGGTAGSASSAITFPSNRWTPVGASFLANNSRDVRVGQERVNNTTNVGTDPTIDRQTVGVRRQSTITSPMSGCIAVPTIWSPALSDAEFDLLISGVFPGLVAPDRLYRGWWMLPGFPPGKDFSGNDADLAVVGTLRPGLLPPVGF